MQEGNLLSHDNIVLNDHKKVLVPIMP